MVSCPTLTKSLELYLNGHGDVVVAALGDGRVVELVAGEVDLGQVMHQWKFTGCAPGNIDVAYHEVNTCLYVLNSDLEHCPTI